MKKVKQIKVTPLFSKFSMFLSGVLMGNVGLFVSLLSNYPIYTIAFLRGLFGVAFLTLFMLISKSFSLKFFKHLFKKYWKFLFIIAAMEPFIIILYFTNIIVSGYAVAAFLLYTSGLFLMILLIITRREHVSRVNLISFVLAIAGVALIMEFWSGRLQVTGIVVGLLSGLCLGIYVFSKKVIYNDRKTRINELEVQGNFDAFITWWPTLFLALAFLPFGILDLPKLSFIEYIISLLLGLVPTALAFTLNNLGLRNDTAGNAYIFSYFETVMASINTAIFLHNLSIFTIMGGSLIVIANFIVLRYSK
jgi:drug/metabolite transporter (DMT)-like permease